MTHKAVRVEDLSKAYVVQHQSGDHGLRHRLEQMFRNPVSTVRSLAKDKGTSEVFWALKDVSFDIDHGDAIAVIGRNGAGKSTLLKVLSRITEPTQGRIRIRGRMASLLEVGTGFHQELTGRENIYLNGAILGMSRADIRRNFEAIVDFAEIERFLDTPVKRYSTGMYMRLAFSVAAHLDPDILVVDEVLAVGDAQFQKKCLGKMGQVAGGGRTVLFVSHNMSSVQALCKKAIYLEAGRLKSAGSASDITAEYLRDTGGVKPLTSVVDVGEACQIVGLSVSPDVVAQHSSSEITLRLQARGDTVINELSVLVYSLHQVRVAMIDLRSIGLPQRLRPGDSIVARATVKSWPLVEGDYTLGVYLNSAEYFDEIHNLVTFSVVNAATDSEFLPHAPQYRGLVALDYEARGQVAGATPARKRVLVDT
jgi:lipopolysaccharide transport system ATP-binding protein